MDKKELIQETFEIGAKTALSAIPIGGTLVTCVWDSIKAHSAEKRLQAWKDNLEERLSKVETTLEDVASNEIFVTSMLRATEIALKTAEDEKRKYLADAVISSLDIPIEEGRLTIYLELLEKYSVWHIQILQFFKKPKDIVDEYSVNLCMGSPSDVLKIAFPNLENEKYLINKIIKDLQSDSLLTAGDFMETSMSKSGVFASRTTPLGNEFLEYILDNE